MRVSLALDLDAGNTTLAPLPARRTMSAPGPSLISRVTNAVFGVFSVLSSRPSRRGLVESPSPVLPFVAPLVRTSNCTMPRAGPATNAGQQGPGRPWGGKVSALPSLADGEAAQGCASVQGAEAGTRCCRYDIRLSWRGGVEWVARRPGSSLAAQPKPATLSPGTPVMEIPIELAWPCGRRLAKHAGSRCRPKRSSQRWT